MTSWLRALCPALLLAAVLDADPARAGGDENPSCRGIEDLRALVDCYEARYVTVDEELNRIYVALMHHLEDTGHPERKMLLREAQRAWIPLRDTDCEFAASRTNGDVAYPLVMAMCLGDTTATRTDQLLRYLTCSERDFDCLSW